MAGTEEVHKGGCLSHSNDESLMFSSPEVVEVPGDDSQNGQKEEQVGDVT